MIFGTLKLVIWLAGIAVISLYALQYFGYEVNRDYWNDSRAICEEKLNQCRKDIVKSGIEGAKETCDWKCVDPKLLIRKPE